MNSVILFARGNEEANRWLAQHPMVLGVLFLGIGLLVGGWGLYELRAGVARSKYGKVVQGAQGKILAIVRIVAGAGCILFGLFKMLFG